MDTAARAELLELISDAQAGDGASTSVHGTAPVTVTIGYVDASNIVRRDGVTIKDAPAKIVSAVNAWSDRKNKSGTPGDFTLVSVAHGGLFVS